MVQWSKKIDRVHFQHYQKGREKKVGFEPEQPKDQGQLQEDETEETECLVEKDSLNLIECICIYGPSSDQIFMKDKTDAFTAKSELLFISEEGKREKYSDYGRCLYPEGDIGVRRVGEEEVMTRVNRIIFKNHRKREDCLVYLFQRE